jgi:hypothetical protein
MKDYNHLWIPYCSGDIHMGSIEDKNVAGESRDFDGRNNINLILARAVLTWPKLTNLFVTGESAGGFAAVTNYDVIRSTWPSADTKGLSSPRFKDYYCSRPCPPLLRHDARRLGAPAGG